MRCIRMADGTTVAEGYEFFWRGCECYILAIGKRRILIESGFSHAVARPGVIWPGATVEGG